MQPQLVASPDWRAAAAALTHGLVELRDDERRIGLIEKICADLGAQLYPAFIMLLAAVMQYGTPKGRGAVADALAYALATGRLPAGPIRAWGARSFSVGAPLRSVGPLEFLCAWHRQSSEPLGRAPFEAAMLRMLTLIGESPSAAQLYAAKLQQDLDAPLEGAFTRQTRQLLAMLAEGLRAHLPARQMVDRLLLDSGADAPFGLPAWQLR